MKPDPRRGSIKDVEQCKPFLKIPALPVGINKYRDLDITLIQIC
jgi:hypothetical protein